MSDEFMSEISERDLIRELEFENARLTNYFDYLYRTLQFTFVAIVAVFLAAADIYNSSGPSEQDKWIFFSILLYYVLPACIYVFGCMYIFNVYALSICGKRAEDIHKLIYDNKKIETCIKGDIDLIKKYVISDRKITFLTYGVCLGFYIVCPLASITIALFCSKLCMIWMIVLASVFYIIYIIIITIVIVNLVYPFFFNDKTKKRDVAIKRKAD